jgi:hypothetical protein
MAGRVPGLDAVPFMGSKSLERLAMQVQGPPTGRGEEV